MPYRAGTDLLGQKHHEDCNWLELYPKLQKYCRFLSQNQWDGDDLAQEAFLKALTFYSPKHKMTAALLNKIAYHHWIDVNRKRKKETVGFDQQSTVDERYSQPDSLVNAVEILQKFFTPKQAIIFLLKEAFQYQVKEIAEILDTTEMAVKSLLHRAKKRLEKVNEEEQIDSVEVFWKKEQQKMLAELFNNALKDQDPSILIQSIPLLLSNPEVPKMAAGPLLSMQKHSPLSTLCMAA